MKSRINSLPWITGSLAGLSLMIAATGLSAAPIHDAAKAGDAALVFSMIETDPTMLEIRDNIGASPLFYAASRGYLEIVQGLIDRGAETTVATVDGLTPLHWAALHGHLAVCRVLLDHGADVNARSTVQANTPLHEVWNGGGHQEIAELLIERGADVDAVENWYGMSILHYAVVHNLPALAQVLVENGANMTLLDASDRTPASYARSEAMQTIFKSPSDR